MDRYERRRALDSKLGRRLKEFLGDALNDARQLPGKARLRARIEEEFGDVAGIDKDMLFSVYAEMARRGQDPGKRWDLQQSIAEVSARVAHKLDEADRLIEPAAEDEIDMGAVMEATDRYSDQVGGDLARQDAKESAEAAELVRKAQRWNP